MLCLLGIALYQTVAQAPLPPYTRLETTQLFPESFMTGTAVKGNTLYAGQAGLCVAFDLSSMKRIWAYNPGNSEAIVGVTLGNQELYVVTEPAFEKTSAHLLALNLVTGKLAWSIPRTAASSPVKFFGNVIYTSMAPNRLSAIDARSHRPKWTVSLSPTTVKDSVSSQVQSVSPNSDGIVVNEDGVTLALNPVDGKLLWKLPNTRMFSDELVSYSGVVMIPRFEGALTKSIRSGKELWTTSMSGTDFLGVFGNLFVALGQGAVEAFDPLTGRKVWSHSVGNKGEIANDQYGTVIGDRLFIRGIARMAVFAPNGAEVSSVPRDQALPKPLWSDGHVLVTFDDQRLLRYVHGAIQAVPKDTAARRALAARLAS